MEFESKLIPIMREGVEIVKMIFFKQVKDLLAEAHKEQEAEFIGKLTAAIINEVFGTPNTEEPFLSFATENSGLIQEELKKIPASLPEMRIPLTDALRMQSLCDSQEGNESTETLEKAQTLDILLAERDLPLPHTFMQLVRKLGSGFGLIIPPTEADEPPSESTH